MVYTYLSHAVIAIAIETHRAEVQHEVSGITIDAATAAGVAENSTAHQIKQFPQTDIQPGVYVHHLLAAKSIGARGGGGDAHSSSSAAVVIALVRVQEELLVEVQLVVSVEPVEHVQ